MDERSFDRPPTLTSNADTSVGDKALAVVDRFPPTARALAVGDEDRPLLVPTSSTTETVRLIVSAGGGLSVSNMLGASLRMSLWTRCNSFEEETSKSGEMSAIDCRNSALISAGSGASS